MIALIDRIEAAIDAHTALTRKRASSDYRHEAEIVFGRRGFTAQITVRNVHARGRGAKQMHGIWGDGETAEEAVASLIDRLPHWTEALS